MRVVSLLFAFLVLSAIGFPATIYVPDNYPSIQGAIDASGKGDTIIVRPGTYVENIDFSGKAVTVRSEQGASLTTIDGNRAGSVVTFANGEGADSVLDGFTITNGTGHSDLVFTYGGGIYCQYTSPTITNNTVSGNTALTQGGGVYVNRGKPSIAGNDISGNASLDDGGGIYVADGSPTIMGNTVARNTAADDGGGIFNVHGHVTIGSNDVAHNSAGDTGGGIYCWQSSTIVSNNLVRKNGAGSGGGIFCGGSATIANNTVVGNSALVEGGGINCHSPILTNTILWDNSAPAGAEIFVSSGSPTVTFCDVKGGWQGTGNIDADPLFTDPANDGYHLSQTAAGQSSDSPCVDAGDANSIMVDGTTRTDGIRDTGIPDMGYHYPSLPPHATTVFIPDDYARIQDGILAVVEGGEVIVRAGTFRERIDYFGKAVTVRSEKGPERTVIDGGQEGSVVTFDDGEGPGSVLEGFTVTNGTGTRVISYMYGGGIFCYRGCSPTIRNNIIAANRVDGTSARGGGIYCDIAAVPTIVGNRIMDNSSGYGGGGIALQGESNSATVMDNIITGNSASNAGGGIYCASSPTIANNTIAGNSAVSGGGISNSGSTSPIITGNVFSRNTASDDGGGIYVMSWFPVITNNIIVANSASDGGGGIHIFQGSPTVTNNTLAGNAAVSGGGICCDHYAPAAEVTNTILWANIARNGPEIFARHGGAVNVSHCDVKGGWPGTGNIDACPLFLDPAAGDFHLPYHSPCRNAGTGSAPGLPGTDFEGDPRVFCGCVDIGADEFHPHLYHTGTAVPGGSVAMKLIAPPTVWACLLRGSGVTDPPQATPYGDFHLSLPLLGKWATKSMPGSGVRIFAIPIPSSAVPGSTVPFQALVGPVASYPAIFTNPVVLPVE